MPRQKGVPGLYLDERYNTYYIDIRIAGFGRLRQSTGQRGWTDAKAEYDRQIAKVKAGVAEREKNGGAPQRVFGEAALKYIEDHRHIRTIGDFTANIKLVARYIYNKPLEQVHNGSLDQFIRDRQKQGVKKRVLQDDGTFAIQEVPVSNTTINHTLEAVRRVLHYAEQLQDDRDDGTSQPWLRRAPKIRMLPAKARQPYPLSWEEQAYLFQELPGHLQRMALFKVNTGTREQEVCQLRWAWEQRITDLDTSVFVIPKEIVKNKEDRVVVLNRVALSIIEQCRGMHPEFVFVYRPNVDRFHSKGTHRPNHVPKPPVPVGYMNNNAWDKACLRAAQKLSVDTGKPMVGEFATLRVHDLKHTFGRRLRAAGVPEETRKVLLGHRNGDITVHYSAAELNELLEAANKVCDVSRSAPTLTLLKRTAV